MRKYIAFVKGDTVMQLEALAMIEATEFFGPEANLYLVPDYIVQMYGDNQRGASITIMEVKVDG